MQINRKLTDQIIEASQEFPVIGIVGPRQSGKTTLAQAVFPHHAYISLEDFDIRALAQTDPRKFLSDQLDKPGIILDEIQHAPQLLSYIQTIVDREKKNGYFIVTGSQNFLENMGRPSKGTEDGLKAITQTLAGRMAVFTLLPLSLSELDKIELLPEKIETLIYKGFYPKAHAEKVSVERLYANYLRLYVERDVRQITNVSDLNTFQKFMRLCAGRVGQVLNLTSLGNDCGINYNTAKAWISLLEASYVIFLLHPYYKNFGKRMIKAPKLYFIDTGVICSLLKIRSPQELSDHYLRGNLVENMIISDLLKQQHNQPSLYFWRDVSGHEIDCIIDESQGVIPVEIKAGQTVVKDFFKELEFWKKTTDDSTSPCYLVYGGYGNQSWPQAQVISWKNAGDLIKK